MSAAHPEYTHKMPRFRAPTWMVRFYGLFDGDVAANVKEMGYRPTLEAGHARALLEREPIPVATSVADTATSLIERNLV